MRAGYTDVRNVQQGILGNEHGFGWQDIGLPMVRFEGSDETVGRR